MEIMESKFEINDVVIFKNKKLYDNIPNIMIQLEEAQKMPHWWYNSMMIDKITNGDLLFWDLK